jgi:hypothetical protein
MKQVSRRSVHRGVYKRSSRDSGVRMSFEVGVILTSAALHQSTPSTLTPSGSQSAQAKPQTFLSYPSLYISNDLISSKMAEESTHPAPEDAWKYTGVRVIPADSLDTNTAQTPGTPYPPFFFPSHFPPIPPTLNSPQKRHVPRSSHKLRPRRRPEALGRNRDHLPERQDRCASSWAFRICDLRVEGESEDEVGGEVGVCGGGGAGGFYFRAALCAASGD